MKTKKMNLRAAILCGAIFALWGCGEQDNEGDIQVGPTKQSACKADLAGGEKADFASGSVKAVAQGNSILVTHLDANYNCASKVKMEATLSGTDILITETITNPGELALCMCPIDLSVEIKNLEAGTYTVKVVDADGQVAGAAQATIAGTSPALEVRSLQSACKSSAPELSSGAIRLAIQGGALVVTHEDANYNCCAKLKLQAAVAGNEIIVQEIIENPDEAMCRCMCDYDLSAEVKGLAAGTYTVKVYDTDKQLVGSASITL